MAHPGGGRPRADRFTVQNDDFPPVACQRPGTRSADDPRPDDGWLGPGFRSSADPHPERVVGLEDQGSLGIDEGGPADRRDDLVPLAQFVRPGEQAADDALLAVFGPGSELAVGGQTGKLGRRPRAARRPVVSPAGAKDEVPAIGVGSGRGAEQVDVVDRAVAGEVDRRLVERPTDLAREVEQAVDVGESSALGHGR